MPLETLEPIQPDEGWKNMVSLVTLALSEAPIVDLNHRDSGINARLNAWNSLLGTLPTTLSLKSPHPVCRPEREYAVLNNRIMTPSPDAFFRLLMYSKSIEYGLKLDDARLQSLCLEILQHETDHWRVALDYGAQNTVFGIEYFRQRISKRVHRPEVIAFMHYSGVIPIEGFVRIHLAPEELSDEDLADVGLTRVLYNYLQSKHTDLVAYILKEWYETGILLQSKK